MNPEEAGRQARAAAGGDAVGWKALVEGFSGLVWSVTRAYRLSSADSADVFQTTWLRLAEHVGRLEDPERVGAWLATTARHEALRIARSTARLLPTNDVTILDFGRTENSPEQAVLDSEQAALDSELASRLWRALGELPKRCQQLLRVLIATPPPSYTEVAAALDMPIGSIGPTRARCLKQLRQIFVGREVSESASRAHNNEK
ncbi:MAG: RNA polymerase sigma factor [Micromonosporaceae bacterium]